MIKRTIYLSKKYYIHTKNNQLEILLNKEIVDSIPIEDIGFILLDHPQIFITANLISKFIANNVAVIFCNEKHHPTGMLLNLDANCLQQEVFTRQINATESLKKQLWQQVIKSKISNQALLLDSLGKNSKKIKEIALKVLSGDKTNCEAVAAKKHWQQLFSHLKSFQRERFGASPNNLLNYGYSILRAAMARALAGSGLLNTLGIHHHNRYNAFCLADDMMEPYRPFVDKIVYQLVEKNELDLVSSTKVKFLNLLNKNIIINSKNYPLMTALTLTTASLSKCYYGEKRKLSLPIFK